MKGWEMDDGKSKNSQIPLKEGLAQVLEKKEMSCGHWEPGQLDTEKSRRRENLEYS